ncbi:CYTH domain-containing protein [Butyrivibrio sp. FCS014]|uniref:CYTH domain-containing protein n=1 Tax=Butyrivibrio sp. FCS014 TaxID=1408304 RepID=UPI0004B21A51|nr:CYTH domain-containing protein [Butyrivibrio sp. FCS014]
MGIEIERKFTVSTAPENLQEYPVHEIEQGYLNVSPAIRVRRQDDKYIMTYKGEKSRVEGEIGQVEYNMPLDAQSYEHMAAKADGIVIRKKRYLVPLNSDAYTSEYLSRRPEIAEMLAEGKIKIELDVFSSPADIGMLAEVEFPDEDSARNYKKADWFDEDVTGNIRYSNAQMSRGQ